MKHKPFTKPGHVVAWFNKAEWDQVLEYLYSKDVALQKYALHRISAWRGRIGRDTPVAVESTADLVRCLVLDNSGQLDADDLVLLYGAALVRFVNLITETKQKRVNIPLRWLASKMNIPEWIVNLRHDITHRKLPALQWCRRGCHYVLEWLQQEYWSRQMESAKDNWDSQSDDDEDGENLEEDMLSVQKRRRDIEKKARELLISYEEEQFQAFEKYLNKKLLLNPSTDLAWMLIQIKDLYSENSEILIDMLVGDGFLVPTLEQLDTLISSQTEIDPRAPCIPRIFLYFWMPLLKVVQSRDFILLFIEKLFMELQAADKSSQHRISYLAGWISEILSCYRYQDQPINESKSQKRARMKEKLISERFPLPWKKLLDTCLDAPCLATPHLLQKILENMTPVLPKDTQQKLLNLSLLYTWAGDSGCPAMDQPVYTLESLQMMAQQGSHTSQDKLEVIEDLQEHLIPTVLTKRAADLRGSPWQVCTDDSAWKNFPLGKIPGQVEDPSFLMLENYSTMSVFDQHAPVDRTSHHSKHPCVSVMLHDSDMPLWTHADLRKLKSGLQLF